MLRRAGYQHRTDTPQETVTNRLLTAGFSGGAALFFCASPWPRDAPSTANASAIRRPHVPCLAIWLQLERPCRGFCGSHGRFTWPAPGLKGSHWLVGLPWALPSGRLILQPRHYRLALGLGVALSFAVPERDGAVVPLAAVDVDRGQPLPSRKIPGARTGEEGQAAAETPDGGPP